MLIKAGVVFVVVLVFCLVSFVVVLFVVFFLTQAYNLVSLPGEHENVKKEKKLLLVNCLSLSKW